MGGVVALTVLAREKELQVVVSKLYADSYFALD